MNENDLQELAEMAVKLEATARKLPQGPNRDDLLRDIARFRAQLVARLPSEGLKAKVMTGPRPAGRPWTRAEDHSLEEMLKAGLKAPEIAQKLKRTIGAVHSRKIILEAKPKD
jgi:hypothetical protein